MPSDIQTRFGSTRQSGPEHYFRVQVSLDGGQSFRNALVMKRDDRDGPDRNSTPYNVAWAATGELEREAEAALSRLEERFSAKHNKARLKRILTDVPPRYFPSDAELPAELGVRIADARVGLGVHAGTEPEAWEVEADAVARRRARTAEREGDERMTELFRWIPWFGELANAVGERRREGLVEGAKKVDWAGGKCAVLAEGEDKADPLTFFYHLASIAGGTARKRETVYASVAEVFGIESDLDYSLGDSFIFPTPPGLVVKFNNTGAGPQLLWETFDQACAFGGTSGAAINSDIFAEVLQIKGVGVPKLTQVLFLINPKAFLPFDAKAVLPLGVGGFEKLPAKMSWAEYVDEMGRIQTAFRGCHPYEINVISYLWTSGRLSRRGNRWYQIDTSDDEWRDFRDNHRIHHDGQGEMDRPEEAPPERGQDYRLDHPEPGDVVLVRSGTREGRGVGIVYRNDYGEPSQRNGRIHTLWVNKKHAPLAADMPAARFSRVGHAAYEAFAKSDPYRETLSMLQPPEPPPPPVHDLNTILYGPPGTGKTWHTVTRTVAIVENREVDEVAQEDRPVVKRRFDEYRGAGQVDMVTFHQNTTYEDFVEGIRPVLAAPGDRASAASAEPGGAGEVRYEMSRGVFRRIAERATADPGRRYVLVIDEINRGNIARIFGELITLIEDSKRIGEHDEACVTLPGSKTEFGVPANLHVLGTMNTADRSIALLDTALRRRFVFEEMMPEPSHPDIATDLDGIDCSKVLAAMNRRIAVLLDREHQIGHTYLLRVDSLPALAGTFRHRIVPLLQEYFYDDWEKIQAVLNDNGFVRMSKPPEELVRLDLADAGQSLYDLAPAGDGCWTDATAYRRIYETARADGADLAQDD